MQGIGIDSSLKSIELFYKTQAKNMAKKMGKKSFDELNNFEKHLTVEMITIGHMLSLKKLWKDIPECFFPKVDKKKCEGCEYAIQ